MGSKTGEPSRKGQPVATSDISEPAGGVSEVVAGKDKQEYIAAYFEPVRGRSLNELY